MSKRPTRRRLPSEQYGSGAIGTLYVLAVVSFIGGLGWGLAAANAAAQSETASGATVVFVIIGCAFGLGTAALLAGFATALRYLGDIADSTRVSEEILTRLGQTVREQL